MLSTNTKSLEKRPLQTPPGAKPVPTIRVKPSKLDKSVEQQGQIRPVCIELAEVMFTGRVPLSTWTFVCSVHNKMWISNQTTLYFGKRYSLNRKIYREKLFVPNHRLDLPLDITAFNRYGDVLNISESLRAYSLNQKDTTTRLIQMEQDWTQLMLAFKVYIA